MAQAALVREAEEGAAQKAFDLALPALGPYALDFTRNGRFLLLGGRRGHLALLDWQRAKLLCEVQARAPAPAGLGAGRRPAAVALGGWLGCAARASGRRRGARRGAECPQRGVGCGPSRARGCGPSRARGCGPARARGARSHGRRAERPPPGRAQVRETLRDVQFLHNDQFFAAAQRKYVYIYDKRGVEVHCLKARACTGSRPAPCKGCSRSCSLSVCSSCGKRRTVMT